VIRHAEARARRPPLPEGGRQAMGCPLPAGDRENGKKAGWLRLKQRDLVSSSRVAMGAGTSASPVGLQPEYAKPEWLEARGQPSSGTPLTAVPVPPARPCGAHVAAALRFIGAASPRLMLIAGEQRHRLGEPAPGHSRSSRPGSARAACFIASAQNVMQWLDHVAAPRDGRPDRRPVADCKWPSASIVILGVQLPGTSGVAHPTGQAHLTLFQLTKGSPSAAS
jgi:hypothetical protein